MKTLVVVLLMLVLISCDSSNTKTGWVSLPPADTLSLKYAKNFQILDHGDFFQAIVVKPWKNASESMRYLLVKPGKKAPKGIPKDQTIQLPIDRVVTMSTTQLATLEALEKLGQLVGVADIKRVNSAKVQSLYKQGKVKETGSDASVNLERLIMLNPDVVFAYGVGGNTHDGVSALSRSGLKVVLTASYLENTALGRAEWIKFFGLFMGSLPKANEHFRQVDSLYNLVKDSVAKIDSKRPVVMTGAPFQSVWYTAGGRGFMAGLIKDAGGHYYWAEDTSVAATPRDLETVFLKSANVDIWIHTGRWNSLQQALNEDVRYQDFAPFQKKNVWNNNKAMNQTGGNDWYETGTMRPDLVLRELAQIFHPKLFGDSMNWYKKLY